MNDEEMVGQYYGRWRVLNVVKNYKNGKTYCDCICSCDKHTRKMVYKNSLLNGDSTSCGCLRVKLARERYGIDRTGERYGNLIIREMLYGCQNGKPYCRCDCDCGNEYICLLTNVVSGHTTSCGCNSHDKTWLGRRTNLIGQRFGKLVVVEMLYGYRNGQTYYRCICDCGQESIVYVGNLLQGYTHSRGCEEHKSYGERLIKEILNDNGIYYNYNYRFNDCRNILPLPFDFYLKDYNTCIEYDGIQHFKAVEFFGGEKAFELTKQNDAIKNQYCKDNHINLIRIPYTLSELEVKNIVLSI